MAARLKRRRGGEPASSARADPGGAGPSIRTAPESVPLAGPGIRREHSHLDLRRIASLENPCTMTAAAGSGSRGRAMPRIPAGDTEFPPFIE